MASVLPDDGTWRTWNVFTVAGIVIAQVKAETWQDAFDVAIAKHQNAHSVGKAE